MERVSTRTSLQAACMKEVTQALKVQGRVINALLHREARAQYGATKLGYLWALILPMAQIVIFTGIFWSIGRADIFGSDLGSIATFITTGLLSFTLFTNISNRVMNSNTANKALFGYPLVMPLDAMLARFVLSATTTTSSFAFTLLLLYQFNYWEPRLDSLLSLIAAISITALLGFGIGLVNSYLVLLFPSYSKTYSIITRPLLFMSGVFYLASDQFPPMILDILYYNPLLHCTEWVRTAFYKEWDSNFIDFNYLLSVVLIVVSVGLFAQRISQKKARE